MERTRTALLVIDVQTGAFDGKLVPPVHRGEALLASVSRLVDAARSGGASVIFVQHCAPEGQLLREGTDRWQIHPAVAPEGAEAVVLKRESSAFDGTDLGDLLERENVDTVVTCGLQSEHCVSNTSIGALERGLVVYVAGDAHSTWPTEDDEAEAIVLRQNTLLAARGARVESLDAVASLLSVRE